MTDDLRWQLAEALTAVKVAREDVSRLQNELAQRYDAFEAERSALRKLIECQDGDIAELRGIFSELADLLENGELTVRAAVTACRLCAQGPQSLSDFTPEERAWMEDVSRRRAADILAFYSSAKSEESSGG